MIQPGESRKNVERPAAVPRRRVALVKMFCPLCQHAFEVSRDGDSQCIVCPKCQFTISNVVGAQKHDKEQDSSPVGDTHPQQFLQPSKQLVASSLDRWLAGDPIRPLPVGMWQELMRWCSAHKKASGIMALGLSILVAIVVVLSPAYVCCHLLLLQAIDQRKIAQEECRTAQVVAEQKTAEALRQQLATEKEQRNVAVAQAALEEAEKRSRESEQRLARAIQDRMEAAKESRLEIARQLAEQANLLQPSRPNDSLFLAALSASTYLREGVQPNATLEPLMRTSLKDTGSPALEMPLRTSRGVAISPDGRWMASSGADKTVRLLNIIAGDQSGAPRELPTGKDEIVEMAFSSSGNWLAAAAPGATVYVWDLSRTDSVAPAITLKGNLRRVTTMSISPCGRWVAVSGVGENVEEGLTVLWDLRMADAANSPFVLRGHEQLTLVSRFSSDSHWLITAGEDHYVHLWDLRAAVPSDAQTVLRGHHGWIDSLACTRDGRWLASGGNDGTTRLWRLNQADPNVGAVVLRGHTSWITAMAVSPDDHWLATGSVDNTTRVWDLSSENPSLNPRVFSGHTDCIRALVFTPNGRGLISASQDKTMRLYDLASRDLSPVPTVLCGQATPSTSLAVSPDSRWLVTVGESGDKVSELAVHLWALDFQALVESARLVSVRNLSFQQRTRILQEGAASRNLLR